MCSALLLPVVQPGILGYETFLRNGFWLPLIPLGMLQDLTDTNFHWPTLVHTCSQLYRTFARGAEPLPGIDMEMTIDGPSLVRLYVSCRHRSELLGALSKRWATSNYCLQQLDLNVQLT